jgi:hypothetical protein
MYTSKNNKYVHALMSAWKLLMRPNALTVEREHAARAQRCRGCIHRSKHVCMLLQSMHMRSLPATTSIHGCHVIHFLSFFCLFLFLSSLLRETCAHTNTCTQALTSNSRQALWHWTHTLPRSRAHPLHSAHACHQKRHKMQSRMPGSGNQASRFFTSNPGCFVSNQRCFVSNPRCFVSNQRQTHSILNG